MKFNILLFALLTNLSLNAQKPGHEIKVTVAPIKSQLIYLAHYSGRQFPMDDSAMLNDKSEAVFKGDKKLGGGVYIIVMPAKNRYVEFLVDENEQHFSIQIDTADFTKTVFKNSKLNDAFNKYQMEINEQGLLIEKYKTLQAASAKDSIKYIKDIEAASKKSDKIRATTLNENSDNLMGLIIRLMQEPKPTRADSLAADKKDTLFYYHFIKNHYWDDIYFFDERLSRMPPPLFDERVDKYFAGLVYPSSDSVIKELDFMLSYAGANQDMQRYLLVKFVNRYFNMKYMWEDAVFVHLYQKYFADKTYSWFDEKGKKIVRDKAYSLMANIMGNKAENIILKDAEGKSRSLHDISAKMTLVVFFDPNCGHCKETLPKLDSLYKSKWKKDGVKVFTVAKEVDTERPVWIDFITKYHIGEFTNVYYSRAEEKSRVDNNIPGYMQLYDVETFPTIFLLDVDKKIIAKKLTWQQADDIIQIKLKNQLK